MRFFLLTIVLLSGFSFGAPLVRVATMDFPPYVSRSLPGSGWAWQVMEAAFASQRYEARLFIFPWSRAIHQVRNGTLDALYLANKTPDREKWAYFSDQVGLEEAVLWKRRSNSVEYLRLKDLKGLLVGGLRGSAQKKFLEQRGIEVISVKDFSQGIKMLTGRRLDYLVGDRIATNYFLASMQSNVAEAIDYISPPVYTVGLHLAVAKSHPQAQEYIDTFNRGLLAIRESGQYQRILQQYALTP